MGGQTILEGDFWQKHAEKHLMDKFGAEVLGKMFGDKSKQEQNRMATYGAKTIDEANETAKKLSAISLVSVDDPPILMTYSMKPDAKVPDNPKKIRGWFVHHVDFGIALKNKTDKLGLEAYLKYPGEETKYKSLVEFFVDKLFD